MISECGYKGISFPFRFNSKGGIAMSTTSSTDFSHIEESIQQIIYTFLNERIFELNLGFKGNAQLFKNLDDEIEKSTLAFLIKDSIENLETRVEVESVSIDYVDDYGAYVAILDIFVKKYLQVYKMNVILNSN